jgi:hypothetical protein
MATSTVKAKSIAIDRRLVKELQTVLKGKPGIDVIGHLAVPSYCCGNGTVALVKIDKGRPVEKK